MFRKQRIILCIIGVSMVVAQGSVRAAGNNEEQTRIVDVEAPGSEYVIKNEVKLSISSYGAATITGSIRGVSGVTLCSYVLSLQRYDYATASWKNVNCWTDSSQSPYFSFEKHYAIANRGTYRCKLVTSVWKGGKREDATDYSANRVY